MRDPIALGLAICTLDNFTILVELRFPFTKNQFGDMEPWIVGSPFG